MSSQYAQRLALFSLLALIVVCLTWELWLAPVRSGWLALKALPLCLPLTGVAKGRIYTFQWSCMFILLYFAEAVMRVFDTLLISRVCALISVGLTVVYFVACLLFIRAKQAER